MKFVKRITALFLALTMVMAMGITAFADEAKPYTISAKSDDTHTYTVYQIFKGDYSNGKLSNVEAGTDFKTNNGKGTSGADLTAKEAAEALADWASKNTTATDAQKLVQIEAYANLTTSYGTVSANNPLSVEGGYYLIKDTTETLGEGDAYSLYIVEVANNVTINAKKKTVDFEKKVKDTNDTTGATSEWQDSADYDIGDDVPFKLTATVAADLDSYVGAYHLTFHDKLEAGKFETFDSTTIKVFKGDENGTAIDSSEYSIKTTGIEDGCTFEVNIPNVKEAGISAGDKVTVTFTAKLAEGATIGKHGNINQAKLEYSNNPNDAQGGDKGETPWDNVIVFTYQLNIDKVDNDSQALGGAAFELLKKDSDSTWKSVAVLGATKSEAAGADGKYTYTADGKNATTFSAKGLDDGTYKIVEVITPAGYSTAKDLEFTVDASHEVKWANGDTDRDNILTKLEGGDSVSGTVDTGVLSTDVVNKPGSTLPSTGGMGTTVLYIAGIAMIVVAGVVVIARKRNA